MLWCFNRFLSYHKLNYKSLGNNLGKVFNLSTVFQLYLSVYGLFSYLLTFSINKSRLKGEKSVCGDGNCFYRAVAFRRDETGAEKHEVIRRWSGSLFQDKIF